MDHDDEASVLAGLLGRCRTDHHAWVNGDGSPYALPDDGTILGAVGGWSLGGADTAARQREVARRWRTGRGTVELIAGGATDSVAWLVMIESAEVSFRDRPDTHRWALRVTEIFRRDGGEWVRFHRHADPLVDRHDLEVLLQLLDAGPG